MVEVLQFLETVFVLGEGGSTSKKSNKKNQNGRFHGNVGFF